MAMLWGQGSCSVPRAWSRFDHYFNVGGHKIHSRGFVQGSVLTTPRLSKGHPNPPIPGRRTSQNYTERWHRSTRVSFKWNTSEQFSVRSREEVYGALPAALLPTFPCDSVLKNTGVGKKFSSPEGGILRSEFGGIKILQKYFLSSSGD